MQICDTNKKARPYQSLWVTIDFRRERKKPKKEEKQQNKNTPRVQNLTEETI